MKRTALLMALIALFMMPTNPAHAGDATFWSTGIGAALGGYIGSTIGKGRGNLAATAAGVFIGAGLGNSYGRAVDRSGRTHYAPRMQQATYYAPAYRPYRPNYVAPIANVQPQNMHMYPNRYSPPNTTRVEQGYMGQHPHNKRMRGRHCREFTQTIRIDGQIKESYGIACMRPDGSWQIQK